jgi:hypothetical protein
MMKIDGSMRRREQRLGLGSDLTKSSQRNDERERVAKKMKKKEEIDSAADDPKTGEAETIQGHGSGKAAIGEAEMKKKDRAETALMPPTGGRRSLVVDPTRRSSEMATERDG